MIVGYLSIRKFRILSLHLIVGDDTIVEIKCPYSAREFSPIGALISGIGEVRTFFDKNDSSKMNNKHAYYFQVQGQLHITKRDYCIFAVWTPSGLHHIIVERDDSFWNNNMVSNLCRFYEECLVPEIVDSRIARTMQIWEPDCFKCKISAELKKEN